jgi:hypothetical protein
LKSYREFLFFGFLTMLLATAAAFSTTPAAKADTSGFGPVSPNPITAANETSQGLVITSASLFASSLSRDTHSSQHGIAPLSITPVILESQALGVVDILTIYAREIGLHQLLRAPPARPLN